MNLSKREKIGIVIGILILLATMVVVFRACG
jgi:hypothetical protein